jgi:hypothetical protein
MNALISFPQAIDDASSLKPHPLAEQFDMIEDGDDGGAAFEALKASIAKSGIKMPIWLFEGKVLDGRNRLKAGLAVGHKFTTPDFNFFHGTAAEAKAFVDAANIHRRHHSKDQKAKLVKARIAEQPGASNRQIAKLCAVSHTFVNKVREGMAAPEVDDRKLKALDKAWNDDLTDEQRERFVKAYAVDIRELLEAVSTQNL